MTLGFTLSPSEININATLDDPMHVEGEIYGGTPGVKGDQGESGFAPDLPYVEIDLAPFLFFIFEGRQFNLGEGGVAIARWQRVARTMDVYFTINIAPDGDHGVMALDPIAFGGANNIPAESQIVEAGPFSYAVTSETSQGANDGYFMPLGSAMAPLGDNNKRLLTFVTADGHATDGGLGNLWQMSEEVFSERGISIVGRTRYECKHAANYVEPLPPEERPGYLGTWSPNSRNINFVAGGSQSIDTYVANEGDILKIRSASATLDFGETPFFVNIGDYIHYEDGHWRLLELEED